MQHNILDSKPQDTDLFETMSSFMGTEFIIIVDYQSLIVGNRKDQYPRL